MLVRLLIHSYKPHTFIDSESQKGVTLLVLSLCVDQRNPQNCRDVQQLVFNGEHFTAQNFFCHLNLRTYRFVLLVLIMSFSARPKSPLGVSNFFFVSTLTESSQLPFFLQNLNQMSFQVSHQKTFLPTSSSKYFFSDCFLNLPQCFHIPLKIADIRTG